MSLKKKCQKSLEQKWCMRFKTTHPDGNNFDGVVTEIKPDFIVLREEIDFQFNGIVILPKRVITGYRDGKYDRCCNEILREDGAIENCHTPEWLGDCESLRDVITELDQRDIWPVVETIDKKGSDTGYCLGPITETDANRFCLYYYDAAGKWKREYEIRYKNIFKIEFDSNYLNHFNKYMRDRIVDTPAKLRSKREAGNEFS